MAKLRKTLGDWKQPEIQAIMKLVETQSKTTIVNLCLSYAEKKILPIYKKSYPTDNRPQMAIDSARAWLRGEKKLPEVKRVILNECHASAREAANNPAAQAAARAIGQAASTIHVVTHSLGIAFYGAAAVAYDKVGLHADAETYDEIARKEFVCFHDALKKVAVENEPNPAKVKWNCGK